MFATVVTSSKSKGIGGGLTYESENDIALGSLVTVPLRKAITEGIVIARSLRAQKDIPDIKKVTETLGTEPLLPPALAKTVHWLADYYMCPVRQALGVALPPPSWSLLLEKKEERFSLTDTAPKQLKAKKQQTALDFLTRHPSSSFDELSEETGTSRAVLHALVKKGYAKKEFVIPKSAEKQSVSPPSPPSVTKEDQVSWKELLEEKRPSLVWDEPASSRETLYRFLLHETLKSGRSAIVLFPEIHSAREFHEAYAKEWNGDVFLTYGTLSPGAQRKQFRAIARSKQCVVIGTRSALFGPVKDIGLVIMDDEHDWSYKQAQTPRYHARLAAEVLCRHADAKLVLTSATPSLESLRHTVKTKENARFHLLRKKSDAIERKKIRTVDLTQANFGTSYPLTPVLIEAIGERLKRKEQSLLFLNHRGSASAVLCLDCKTPLIDDTGMPMTMYEGNGAPWLLNRITGNRMPLPDTCPSCKSVRLHPVGAGTQRIESLLKKFFPHARIARADSDALTTPKEQLSLFADLRERKIDILIATQLGLKAAVFPHVTLAAALVADTGFSLPHVRAGERTVQLLSKLLKTCMKETGEVIVQTFRPEAPEMRAITHGMIEEYLAQESIVRKESHEPPHIQTVALLCRGLNAKGRALQLSEMAKRYMTNDPMLGKAVLTATAYASFSDPREWVVEMKGPAPREMLRALPALYTAIDIDPLGVM